MAYTNMRHGKKGSYPSHLKCHKIKVTITILENKLKVERSTNEVRKIPVSGLDHNFIDLGYGEEDKAFVLALVKEKDKEIQILKIITSKSIENISRLEQIAGEVNREVKQRK